MQGRAVQPAEVTELAALPGKPELYAKLLFVLQAPMVQIVSVLNAAPRDFDERAGGGEKKKQRILDTYWLRASGSRLQRVHGWSEA